MKNFCKICEHLKRCEETKIQLCKLKDNEKAVCINGKWIIQHNWS